MYELLTVILLLLGGIVILILFFNMFAGVFAFPFYALGFVEKLIAFPLALINQVFYPVGPLPFLVLGGFVLYFFVRLMIRIVKAFASLKTKL